MVLKDFQSLKLSIETITFSAAQEIQYYNVKSDTLCDIITEHQNTAS